MYAYLDSGSNIVGLSDVERSLAEAQEVNPDIASIDPSPSQADVDAFKWLAVFERNRKARIVEVDARTDQLVAAGFTYASKQFSLTLTSQMKMVGAHAAKDDPAMVYPIVWNTLTDDDTYSIADAADLHAFYLTAVGTLRAHLDSGTDLKNSIRAATTQVALNGIVDNR